MESGELTGSRRRSCLLGRLQLSALEWPHMLSPPCLWNTSIAVSIDEATGCRTSLNHVRYAGTCTTRAVACKELAAPCHFKLHRTSQGVQQRRQLCKELPYDATRAPTISISVVPDCDWRKDKNTPMKGAKGEGVVHLSNRTTNQKLCPSVIPIVQP